MKPLLRIIYAFAFASLLFACDKPKEPEFKWVEDVQLVGLTKEKAVVRALIVMENPNSIGVNIAGMSVNTFMNGIKVATTTQTAATKIPPGTFKMPLEIEASLDEVFNKKNIGGAISALISKKVDLKYEGDITLSMAGIEMNMPILHEEEMLLKKSEVEEPVKVDE